MQLATLALEDGTVLQGEGFGAPCEAVFELVFNTSQTGYQEILTDPSYRGQGVLFTVSHIGNVGINREDLESQTVHASAVIVRELSPFVSNWRAVESLGEWLARQGVPGISKVDTRFLTRRLRDGGTMKAALSTCGATPESLVELARRWPGLDGRDTVGEVTSRELTQWNSDAGARCAPDVPSLSGLRLLAYDFGAKHSIFRHLAARGAQVTVVPAYTTCREALALQPDGLLLSNGPGDPAGLPSIVAEVRGLIDSGIPIFGICLGHQLIGRALGAQTVRLKFGHHSGNHPVKDLRTGKVLITAQNHNYAVALEGLDPGAVEVTHLSLNDGTLEGMQLKGRPVFSVQFHPEASPGPHDAHGLFERFSEFIRENGAGRG
jgi:carbamoyl-phosphate synthase small subunit